MEECFDRLEVIVEGPKDGISRLGQIFACFYGFKREAG